MDADSDVNSGGRKVKKWALQLPKMVIWEKI